MEDCGGAGSHGRGYHVRGVCVVFPVLKGEREERDVRDGRLFRSFTFLGTCEGDLFGILGTPTKVVGVVQGKENVAANADVPSGPFCIAALLVAIVVAWR